MTLRRRSKAVENLYLASLQGYIIGEEFEISPRKTYPIGPGIFTPVRDDAEDNAAIHLQEAVWQSTQIDGAVLCDYQRFVDAMVVPTRAAIEPWVEWVERQLGWEKAWILDYPVTSKQGIIKKFEGVQRMEYESTVVISKTQSTNQHPLAYNHNENQESEDELRTGAVLRISFCEDERKRLLASTSRTRLCEGRFPRRPPTPFVSDGSDQPNDVPTILFKEESTSGRSMSALNLKEMKGLKEHLSSLKKKVLINPWRRIGHPGKL
jgi:hypothetical protein